MCKFQTGKFDQLKIWFHACKGYGGTVADWGEGTLHGVGSFHSQSNSDNDRFSVICKNSCIVD